MIRVIQIVKLFINIFREIFFVIIISLDLNNEEKTFLYGYMNILRKVNDSAENKKLYRFFTNL